MKSERSIHQRAEDKLNTEINYWKKRSATIEEASLASVNLKEISEEISGRFEGKLKDLTVCINRLENELKGIWARIDRLPFELGKRSKRPTSKS